MIHSYIYKFIYEFIYALLSRLRGTVRSYESFAEFGVSFAFHRHPQLAMSLALAFTGFTKHVSNPTPRAAVLAWRCMFSLAKRLAVQQLVLSGKAASTFHSGPTFYAAAAWQGGMQSLM